MLYKINRRCDAFTYSEFIMYFIAALVFVLQARSYLAYEIDRNLTGIIHEIKIDDFEDPYKVNLTNLGKTDSKIINGEQADEFEFPYQAALYFDRYDYQSFCGGSLITEKYIITAAHCTYISPRRIIAILGNEDLRAQNNYEKRIDVIRYIVHKKFNRETLRHDISLLELSHALQYNTAIQPVALPRYSDMRQNYIHKIGIVSGFGQIQDDGETINDLMFTFVKVMDNLRCNNIFSDRDATYTNICTTGVNHKGPCHGDSGGPLVIEKRLIGIVSYGAKYCTIGYPIVYTRVPRYLDWISYNTGIEILE